MIWIDLKSHHILILILPILLAWRFTLVCLPCIRALWSTDTPWWASDGWWQRWDCLVASLCLDFISSHWEYLCDLCPNAGTSTVSVEPAPRVCVFSFLPYIPSADVCSFCFPISCSSIDVNALSDGCIQIIFPSLLYACVYYTFFIFLYPEEQTRFSGTKACRWFHGWRVRHSNFLSGRILCPGSESKCGVHIQIPFT